MPNLKKEEKMATKSSYGATFRYARSVAYRLYERLDAQLFGLPSGRIPEELSVKESHISWDENSQKGSSIWTFRFSGGVLVRMVVLKHYDDHFQMYFREIRSATIGFQRPRDDGRDLIVLANQYFYDWRNFGEFPASFLEVVKGIRHQNFLTVAEFETAVRGEAKKLGSEVGEVRFVIPSSGRGFVYKVSGFHHLGERPQVDQVWIPLGESDLVKFRSEIIARDEQRMTTFMRDSAKNIECDHYRPYSTALALELSKLTDFGLAWTVPLVYLPVRFTWGDKPYVKILQEIGGDLELEVSLPQDVSLEFDFQGEVDYSGKL